MVACAEAWRGDGAILASPMGLIPTLGARLAQLTFAPDLLVTDGEAMLIAPQDSDPDGSDSQDSDPHGRGADDRMRAGCPTVTFSGWSPPGGGT